MYDKLVPSPTPDTQPYWDGLLAGKLVLQRCADACRNGLPDRIAAAIPRQPVAVPAAAAVGVQ